MRSYKTRIGFIAAVVGIGLVTAVAFAQAPKTGPIMRFTATTDGVSGAGDMVRFDILSWSTDADRDQLLKVWTHPAPPPAPAPAAAPPAAPAAGARGARGGAGVAGGNAPPLPAGAPPAAGAAGAGARGARGGNGPAAAPAPAPPPVETPESALQAALQKASSAGILWTSESVGYSLRFAYRIPQPDGGQRIIFATDRRLGAWSDQWWQPKTGTLNKAYEFSVIELRVNAKGEGEGRTSLTGKIVEDTAAKSIALENYSALPVMFKLVKRQ